MGKGIAHYTFIDRLKLWRVLPSVAKGPGDVWSTPEALGESIAAVESAVKLKPREWIYWYVLSDWYPGVGRLAEAVRAAERCYELRPKDPRSPYMLASAWRALTRARHLGDARTMQAAESIHTLIAAQVAGVVSRYDPEASLRGLEELGVTIDQAAERALVFFELSLRLGIPDEDGKDVQRCLAAMYVEFPHLEQTVKATAPRPVGLFAPTQSHFNEAVGHFYRLRYLMGEPKAARRELLEVIRLCQLAIAETPRLGDAYVMLAHALSMAADEMGGVDNADGRYFLLRAAAVIQHWRHGSFHTKNEAVGLQMLDSIRGQLLRAKCCREEGLERTMESLRRTALSDTLRPESYTKMQAMLTSAKPPTGASVERQ